MTEQRQTYYGNKAEGLKPAKNHAMMALSSNELETLRRRLLNLLMIVEELLGLESSLKKR